MLALAAAGIPKEKCLCKRSGVRADWLVPALTPSISVMKVVVRGTVLNDRDRREMNFSTVSEEGDVSEAMAEDSDDLVVTILVG